MATDNIGQGKRYFVMPETRVVCNNPLPGSPRPSPRTPRRITHIAALTLALGAQARKH